MPQRFPQRRPVLFAGLLLVLFLGTWVIAYAVAMIWRLPMIVVSFISEWLWGLIAVVLLTRFRWWREVGFRIPQYSLAIWSLAAPCIVLLTNANTVFPLWDIMPGRSNALFFFIFAMLVGFVEEAYFRGLILRALVARGPWFAAIVSSVVFGGLHLLHLIEGQNLAATLLQVASATATGFLFAAVALRTQSILPLIVVHGLTDFIAFLVLNGTVITYSPSPGSLKATVVEALIYVILGANALRGMREPELKPDLPRWT